MEKWLIVLAVEFQNKEEKEILTGLYGRKFIREDIRNRILIHKNRGAILLVVSRSFDESEIAISELEKIWAHAEIFLMKRYQDDNLDMWWKICMELFETTESVNSSESIEMSEAVDSFEPVEEERSGEKPFEERVSTELVESYESDSTINSKTLLNKLPQYGITREEVAERIVKGLELNPKFIPLLKKSMEVDKVNWSKLGYTMNQREKFNGEFRNNPRCSRTLLQFLKDVNKKYYVSTNESIESEDSVDSADSVDSVEDSTDGKAISVEDESSLQVEKLASVIEIIKAKGITVENLLNEVGLEKLSMEKQDAIKKLVKEFMNSTNDANTFVENMDLEERLKIAEILDSTFPEQIQVQEFLEELKKFS
mgnify:CR=1 FL=1